MGKTRNSANDSTTNLLIVAGVVTATAAAGALLVYALTRRPSPQKVQNTPAAKPVAAANVEPLTKEALCTVLAEITQGVQQVIMRLAQEEQKIVQSPQAHQITHEQLQRFLIQRFQEGVAEVETAVYKKNKVSEVQVKAASDKFEKDADVIRVVTQLKSVYGAVMGGNPDDLPAVPDFLTKEKTLELLERTMAILREQADVVSKALVEQGLDRVKEPEKFQTSFQMNYGKAVEEARKQLYVETGITNELVVQAAVVKYQADAWFQQRLKTTSEAHNAEMANMGFFPNQGGM